MFSFHLSRIYRSIDIAHGWIWKHQAWVAFWWMLYVSTTTGYTTLPPKFFGLQCRINSSTKWLEWSRTERRIAKRCSKAGLLLTRCAQNSSRLRHFDQIMFCLLACVLHYTFKIQKYNIGDLCWSTCQLINRLVASWICSYVLTALDSHEGQTKHVWINAIIHF